MFLLILEMPSMFLLILEIYLYFTENISFRNINTPLIANPAAC